MTMLSFRVAATEAAELQRWAQALGVDGSEILREARHHQLVGSRGEHDAQKWERARRRPMRKVACGDRRPGGAEDWADWGDAAR